MGSESLSEKHALPFKTNNKLKRNDFNLKQKKVREAAKRDERLRRKREEAKNPRLREERLARNVPVTIDKKRTWDFVDGDEEDILNAAVDVERLKRQKLAAEEAAQGEESEAEGEDDDEDDRDSMLDESESSEDSEEDGEDDKRSSRKKKRADSPPRIQRGSSPSGSTTTTSFSLTPESLAAKFPALFSPARDPKILITTGINSTLHKEAELLTKLFPNSNYVRRTAHRYGHKYSVKEISKFAANREYTTVIVMNEDQKKPSGLDVVHLPNGPMFHFSISNWIEGSKLPGHGNPTEHYPELILNNFRTPLGLLTAHLFRTMFPPQPEIEGRQVVTLHNQRDYIFVRRHRYVFRDKRATEKSVVDADGKPMKGVEDIRAGLQELGPRFTLKLRRIDKGIQKASGQEWQWKAGSEKVRTRFAL
ncbi:putative RNA processing factor 1 [Neofusicoccum parvum]|uniref:RNA processing factor 1 n=1 Tax=Neofusicoccum parvum TaxID=310453 RepID=A0ACB5SIC2_9PEZI|nr:putative RNA processing factor 1 [Neofusicoccum parvum]GME46135.1 putative RNA processing factor 1 [Neofusicoccum parvum]